MTLRLNIKEGYYQQFMALIETLPKEAVEIERNPAEITFEEAKRRVSEAVEEYRSGTMKTVPYEEGMADIDRWLKSIQ